MNFDINRFKRLSDLSINELLTLRDTINDAIEEQREEEKTEYLDRILSALHAAYDAGYRVYFDGDRYEPDCTDVDIEYHDED